MIDEERRGVRLGPMTALAAALTAAAPGAAQAELASDWADAMHGRARLIAGAVGESSRQRVVVGVEIDIGGDWKTYWRTPGDAGGVPPLFDWSASDNLARAEVLYPVPKVMTDRAGSVIGYKGPVVFPVLVEPVDGGKPMTLDLRLDYGICREICIPVEASLTLEIPARAQLPPSAAIASALARVPRTQRDAGPDDPRLVATSARLEGADPRLVIEAEFPGPSGHARVLVEGPEGQFIPLPERSAEAAGGRITFVSRLSDGVDLGELKGKTLRVTLIGALGQSEADLRAD